MDRGGARRPGAGEVAWGRPFGSGQKVRNHIERTGSTASVGGAGPGERVLVIVGNGHTPILREPTRYAPGTELVETVGYLP